VFTAFHLEGIGLLQWRINLKIGEAVGISQYAAAFAGAAGIVDGLDLT
jgi:hypothetical protein